MNECGSVLGEICFSVCLSAVLFSVTYIAAFFSIVSCSDILLLNIFLDLIVGKTERRNK